MAPAELSLALTEPEVTEMDSCSEHPAGQETRHALRGWDSRSFAPKDAFSILREEICAHGLVWQPSLRAKDDTLQFQWEFREVEKAFITRSSSGPLDCLRTPSDIAKSTVDCIRVALVMSGSMTLTLGQDEPGIANAGDLVVHDVSEPSRMTTSQNFEQIEIMLPRGVSQVVDENSSSYRNLILHGERMSAPLRSCLYYLADRLRGDQQELNALTDAILALLPIDAGYSNSRDVAPSRDVNLMYREIMVFLHQNLRDPSLSAQSVARRFRISERYVFKLFAEQGLRFGASLTDRRLEKAAGDLASHRGCSASIADTAFKWGFNDLSTFNRAFKRKFHCTPSEFRSRF